MFRLLVVSSILAYATTIAAFPQFSQPQFRLESPTGKIAILRQDSQLNPDGSYSWQYETENGIKAHEQGQQRSPFVGGGTSAQGYYSYTAPNGLLVALNYVADENGYQPQSDVLPTPPPIPAAILRSLEWNRAHPEPQQNPFN
ncbi:endocuticle structural glycoprotein SgAbd-2-like [Sitophilus oryzae]|uniref:Endocuticle structural glycoprotein SgAbd-2-like n=1 Tax=Sitophilus oryzae TaxID=7048 RepID=A0A6J2XEP9_SITOR|nr:endocuticle structural glycoprotein SgAbd-2-like [Sitophilus oryzae]